MVDWRKEILKYLNIEKWKSIIVLAINCAKLEKLKEFKDEILLLEKEDRISLTHPTPDEFLDVVKNLSDKNEDYVDKESMNTMLDAAKACAEDLAIFLTGTYARLKKDEKK